MNILSMLCDSLCMDKREVIKFAGTAPHRYKVYNIPKRNSSKSRTIAHPSRELKFIQRLLIRDFGGTLRVHNSAFAYRKGKSIKDNALQHLKSHYLLKMDFQNFFPSITPELFFEVMMGSGILIEPIDKKIL